MQATEGVLKSAFAAVDASSELRAMVVAELTAEHRHWHGLVHHGQLVASVLTNEVTGADRRRLAWAALLHDLVYDARRSDNEELSAELADRWVPPEDRTAVRALMLATKAHDLETDPLTRRFLLADMEVLWTSDPHLYAFYADGIRREYAHVPEPDYRTGRAAVLESLYAGLSDELEDDELACLNRNVGWEIARLST